MKNWSDISATSVTLPHRIPVVWEKIGYSHETLDFGKLKFAALSKYPDLEAEISICEDQAIVHSYILYIGNPDYAFIAG